MPWKPPVRPVSPSVPSATPVAVAPPVAPAPCPLEHFSAAEAAPVVTTLEELKAVVNKEGGTGTLATAIVAPQTGDIPVRAGTPVVLIAKHLMDLPMVKNLLRVAYASWGVFATYVGYKIVDNGSVYGLDWHAILRSGFDAAIISALVAFGISQRAKFNDAAVSSSLSGSAKADAAGKP